jgi:hypothetical protein
MFVYPFKYIPLNPVEYTKKALKLNLHQCHLKNKKTLLSIKSVTTAF